MENEAIEYTPPLPNDSGKYQLSYSDINRLKNRAAKSDRRRKIEKQTRKSQRKG